jgi:glycosyltransferase involved in cell wall biosynthesis
MKVLLCNSFYYLRGGSERCFFDLAELLEAHGHEVIPFSMADPRNRPSDYADYFISHVDFPSRLGPGSSLRDKLQAAGRVIYSREARAKIERLIAATRPDIAHVHGIAHETSPSILPALKQAGIPVVQTLHDYKLLCPNTSFVSHGAVCERCKGHRYYNVVRHRCKRGSLAASVLAGTEMAVHKLLQIYERNVDVFITPSAFLQAKLVEYGIRTTSVNVPNFIHFDRFEPCYTPENYFIYVGRLVHLKGVHTLLEAMRFVQGSHLYIAGRGEQEDELRAYVQAHGLTNVTFLGHLGLDHLVPLVQRALFSVVPSEWYENYSMTVIESLACGTPVVGADIGGIPEQVRDGQTGLLFEPGNARQLAEKIRWMLAHREQAREMGRNGRLQVERVNHPQVHYEQTVAIYQGLLQQKAAIAR